MSRGEEAPWLWIISGPNGSGKTTFAKRFVPKIAGGVPFVNVDELAKGIDPDDVDRAARRAGTMALRTIDAFAQEGRSFAIETTLSGNYQRRLLERLRLDGWRTGLVYLWIGTPERAIERITMRVKIGGHNVPAEAVHRRFQRGLKNLPWFLGVTDRASIYDNVATKPRLLATFDGGAPTIVDEDGYAPLRRYLEHR